MKGSIEAVAKTIIDRVYPVGIIVEFAVDADPNAAIGCGTVWTRMADGRTLIAADGSHPIGWAGGAETVTLALSQLPTHRHIVALNGDLMFTYGGGTGANYPNSIKLSDSTERVNNEYPIETADAGNSQPHNNMQPSLAVSRWRRTA